MSGASQDVVGEVPPVAAGHPLDNPPSIGNQLRDLPTKSFRVQTVLSALEKVMFDTDHRMRSGPDLDPADQ